MILGLSHRFGDCPPWMIRMEDVSVLRMLELAAMGRVEDGE